MRADIHLLGPLRSFQRLAPVEKQPIDFSKIPGTYLELKISSYAKYEWVCCLERDKLKFYRVTYGPTRYLAEKRMLQYLPALKRAEKRYLRKARRYA